MNNIQFPLRRLVLATLYYLAFPYFIFFAGWMHWWLALTLSLVFFYALMKYYRQTKEHIVLILPNARNQMVLLLLVCLWCYWAGIGMFSFQNWDYVKHNAILHDLITHPWPVGYSIHQLPSVKIDLVYYLAYYLPAALVGKIFKSFQLALWIQYLYSVLGMMIFFQWFFVLIRKKSCVFALLFMLFSGLDYVGELFLHGKFPSMGAHIEWWAKYWQFSANTSLLFWVPQHAISGWLGTAMFFYFYERREHNFFLFVSCLCVLWSPFVALGLLVLCLFGWWECRPSLKQMGSWPNIIAVILGATSSLFLLSKLPDVFAGLILNPKTLSYWAPPLILFLLLELVVWIFPFWDTSIFKENRRLLHFIFLTLTFLLVYRYGRHNDLAMRTSIPYLFILLILMLRALEANFPRWKKIYLTVIFCLGLLNPWLEISRKFVYGNPHRFPEKNVLEMNVRVVRQYVARKDSLYFRWFAPKRIYLPVAAHPEVITKLRDGSFYGERL